MPDVPCANRVPILTHRAPEDFHLPMALCTRLCLQQVNLPVHTTMDARMGQLDYMVVTLHTPNEAANALQSRLVCRPRPCAFPMENSVVCQIDSQTGNSQLSIGTNVSGC
jgi:hypothetical protein